MRTRFIVFIALLITSSPGVAQFENQQEYKIQLQKGIQKGDIPENLKIICIKRKWPENYKGEIKGQLKLLGFPSNHECQSSLDRNIYDNEIGLFYPSTGKYETLYKPAGKYFVGQINLHWNADKFLFTQSDGINWKIFELKTDGSGLRQVSQTPDDVDSFEPCYLPDGRIVFSSNAPMQCVPCWHGVDKKFVANLYVMNSDGSGMRRLCFDQDHDMHPSVRNNGQVIYSRWDYTGINRLFLRPLMTMNPDGTSQKSVYGSNMWFPSGFYYPKEIPGQTGKFLGIIAGYHGSWRSGKLALLDLNEIENPASGTRQIHGKWQPLKPEIKDGWTKNSWPEFMTPSFISDKYFLTSAWEKAVNNKIGIYLADSENNVTLMLEEEDIAFFEPIPVLKQRMPPVLPERINLNETEANVYIQDIYEGPGLKEVPRGTIKKLRVIAYDFGYVGMAGVDKIGLSGPWEAMRILGTAPVEKDGSSIFKIPANTPVAFQPLDENGNAVQLMRSWVSAMPGETMSCVGCHESTNTVPLPKRSLASLKEPKSLKKWYGPARGFDFEREVQPVLNRYCVHCHNQENQLDLRAEEHFPDYKGRTPGRFDYVRMHQSFKDKYDNKVLYTPAYEALLPYIRRVNAGDDVSLLEPGEYHVNTSELVQVLKEGHKGINMDKESWSRITTWIDMNGPCHGTWNDIYNEPIPEKQNERRWELAKMFGGPYVNPDLVQQANDYDETPVKFEVPEKKKEVTIKNTKKPTLTYKTIDLGNDQEIELVNFGEDYWMGTCEISNAQFSCFDNEHTSRYFSKRHAAERGDGKGMSLDDHDQPVMRVSWNRAMDFCKWLSEKTGMKVTLPTEDQWEVACLAGSEGPFYYEGEDFAEYENMADKTFATYGYKGKSIHGYFEVALDVDLVVSEGVYLANKQFYDGGCVTMPIGSYKPNKYGLYDMHGNAAEWTLSDFNPGEKTVKGGSYLDRPERCRVEVAHGYPAWQNVYNTGFRIVVADKMH